MWSPEPLLILRAALLVPGTRQSFKTQSFPVLLLLSGSQEAPQGAKPS